MITFSPIFRPICREEFNVAPLGSIYGNFLGIDSFL